MSFDDVYDDKTGVIKVHISEEMRESASYVASRYDALLNDPALKKMGQAAKQHTALLKLEQSGELLLFNTDVFKANPHLDPTRMGGETQKVDMRAASASVLNQLIAEEGTKENIQMPALFNTEAQRR